MESPCAQKRQRQEQQPHDEQPEVLPAADTSSKHLQLLTQLAAPEQAFKADFSSFWGGRRNGWSPHALIFATRAEAVGGCDGGGSSRDCFACDQQTGTIRVLCDDVVIKIEVWWKGRAPWGYHFVRIVRNMQYSGEGEPPQGSGRCGLSDEECDKQHASDTYGACARHARHAVLILRRFFLEVDGSRGCAVNGSWQHNGHISLITRTSRADTFNVLNWPSHIQGTPSAFQLRVHAYPDLPPAAIARMHVAAAGSAASAAIVACVKSASLPSLHVSAY